MLSPATSYLSPREGGVPIEGGCRGVPAGDQCGRGMGLWQRRKENGVLRSKVQAKKGWKTSLPFQYILRESDLYEGRKGGCLG